MSAFMRSLIKALEAQGRGFGHGHEKHHSEPRAKAIDLIQLCLGSNDCGATEHEHNNDETLTSWIDGHRKACLSDAATKQYDSAVESAKQFGCPELREVFTAEEKRRCRLDGGEDEDGTLREFVELGHPVVNTVCEPPCRALISLYFHCMARR